MILVDNDVIVHLSELSVVHLLCEAFNKTHPTDVVTLRSAHWMCRSVLSGVARDDAEDFLAGVGAISTSDFGSEYEQIRHLPKMELEAHIYASCCNIEGSIALTGDFNSIHCLALHAPQPVKAMLYGRICSTEQCLLRIIEAFGYESVSKGWTAGCTDHAFFKRLPLLSEASAVHLLRGRLDNMLIGSIRHATPQVQAEVLKLIGWPP